jgi:pimeloyl-ACP methyl ester carboxylesterase
MLGRLPPFLDRADRAYLVDLRGHGDAPGRTTLGASEFDDLVAFLAELPASRILLVGHSLGATLAIRAAADERVASRIAGVVAIAPYRTIATPIGSRLRARHLPRGPALRLALAILRLLGAPTIDTLPAALRLRAPLLVLHGERDRVVSSEEARLIAESAPSGRYEGFASTEHAGHERDEPDRFAALASDFAAEALCPRAS